MIRSTDKRIRDAMKASAKRGANPYDNQPQIAWLYGLKWADDMHRLEMRRNRGN